MIRNFYEKNYRRQVHVISKSLKFNKHLAEDIVQEAYVRAIKHIDTYDDKRGTLNAWFNKILFNTLKTYQLKYGHTISLNEDMEITEDSLEFFLILDHERRLIKNPKHRDVVDMFYLKGYSSNEIVRMSGLTRTNVTTICNRFRNQLREKYGLNL